MKIYLFPFLLLFFSCAGLVGGIAGAAGGVKGPNPDSVQIVMLRSSYQVDCKTIHQNILDFQSKNKDVAFNSLDTPNICQEINSSETIFKNCVSVNPKDEYRISDGNFWAGYNFYLIQVQENKNRCELFLYTKLDFDLYGNPFSTRADCQKGFDSKCIAKYENAKMKRNEIISNIEKRSNISLQQVREEKIFNYYGTNDAVENFKNRE